MELPEDLRTALESTTDAAPRDLTPVVRALSERYREGHARSESSLVRSDEEAMAYAAYRLPATFAAIRAVLLEVRDRQRDLEPRSLLDVGAGPGTAMWAAADVWRLKQMTAIERDVRMIRLGTALASHARSSEVRNAVWRREDVSLSWECEPTDITIAAYVLGELPAASRDAFLRSMWECSLQTCVVVEPGTPRGFALIRHAGDFMVAAGAHVVAPFPQEWTCVESENDWCHFSQRVPRTKIHRSVKQAALSYEDEKYSYLAVSRHPSVPIAGRVIRHPQVRSGHIRLVACTADGIRRIVATRSQREAYRRAKTLHWGSAIAIEEGPLFGL